jgi:hypothetical protein
LSPAKATTQFEASLPIKTGAQIFDTAIMSGIILTFKD